MNITIINSIITALGVTVFLAIVITLHVIQIQIGYSPTDQLMSELALGKYGFAMFFAFISLAVACLGSERILHSARSSIVISMLLWGASLSFFGAGYFKLGSHTEIHIGLVSLAFILLGLTMYLTPRLISGFNSLSSYCICWGLCLSTALSVALGKDLLPIGIAQRFAATFILFWFSWLAIINIKRHDV